MLNDSLTTSVLRRASASLSHVAGAILVIARHVAHTKSHTISTGLVRNPPAIRSSAECRRESMRIRSSGQRHASARTLDRQLGNPSHAHKTALRRPPQHPHEGSLIIIHAAGDQAKTGSGSRRTRSSSPAGGDAVVYVADDGTRTFPEHQGVQRIAHRSLADDPHSIRVQKTNSCCQPQPDTDSPPLARRRPRGRRTRDGEGPLIVDDDGPGAWAPVVIVRLSPSLPPLSPSSPPQGRAPSTWLTFTFTSMTFVYGVGMREYASLHPCSRVKSVVHPPSSHNSRAATIWLGAFDSSSDHKRITLARPCPVQL
ncbi:hypothetical protein FB451DRAFT_1412558 [Mycena latifolia]|nr:hypothetical protein FB451DRAFT_1412558 [Mycena latifolia]